MKDENPKGKALHGNSAKIAPKKHVSSLYQANRVTISDHKDHETPMVDDDDVAYAKSFVDENHK